MPILLHIKKGRSCMAQIKNVWGLYRITSYNVCYTKLLRSQGEKVVVEVFSSCENYIEKIKEIPNVADVECHNT